MMRAPDVATRSLPVAKGRPRLVLIAGERTSSHIVPVSGIVTLGRDPSCDVRVDDPSISRRHARIQIDETITVEDLGSSNGTVVRGERLARNTPVELRFDEVVTIGTLSVVVQKHAPPAVSHTVWGHGYFELRLAEECARATRDQTRFALMRVRAHPTEVERLVAAVRSTDVIGAYAPGEWEVLVANTGDGDLDRIAAEIQAAIAGVRVEFVSYPDDGHDAWTLSAAVARKFDDTRARRAETEPSLARRGAMQPLLELVERVAVGDISVLILGETGVGKEVVAEELHRRSRRAGKPLLKLNCAAMPEQLLESELFGHEKGAFTGAVASKVGLVEEADGGTVFLDEVGELPAATQAKLLRMLEQREILRVGGLKPRQIDVRFIAATHRDLDEAIGAGRFREDLYYRLAGVTLDVPPLRERTSEIDELVARFARRTAVALGRRVPEVSAAARALLHAYRWPGNIRELRNVIERATLLSDGQIESCHLPEDRMSRPEIAPFVTAESYGHVREQGSELERRAIVDALARCNGNQTAAARLLGISRRTLTNKLNLHGFERPRKRT